MICPRKNRMLVYGVIGVIYTKDVPGIDEKLYTSGQKDIKAMKSFLSYLQKASVLKS